MIKFIFIFFVIALLYACNNNTSTQATTTSDTTVSVADSTQSSTTKNNNVIDSSKSSIDTTKADKLIVPGERIGKAVLNTNSDSLETLFGKADFSDAAMGKAWLTWYGKRDEHNNKTELDIYTSYKDTSMREKSVQQIRTTSSYFNTGNNIHVYSSLEEIKEAFPQVHKIQQNMADAKKFIVYDDVQNGIAFTIVNTNGQKICTAIFVHLKGRKVTDIYIAAPQN
ncbi:MAG: hypothetical protein JO072_01835 [Parafilimonas sp.]|nr:hypothetical protein [Parafilimonas sp.]